jgi:hypothetical protein
MQRFFEHVPYLIRIPHLRIPCRRGTAPLRGLHQPNGPFGVRSLTCVMWIACESMWGPCGLPIVAPPMPQIHSTARIYRYFHERIGILPGFAQKPSAINPETLPKPRLIRLLLRCNCMRQEYFSFLPFVVDIPTSNSVHYQSYTAWYKTC